MLAPIELEFVVATAIGLGLLGGTREGRTCNIPNWYVFHSCNCLGINYLDYLGTATKREIKRAMTLLVEGLEVSEA